MYFFRDPRLKTGPSHAVEVLVNHFGKGKAFPATELTIGQTALWIGRLGGHLNRKGDRMPGVRTLCRGLHDLILLVAGFRAAERLRESLWVMLSSMRGVEIACGWWEGLGPGGDLVRRLTAPHDE